ncbi:MAG: hypothetical protein QM605_05535 [Sphingobium sp.]
MKFSPFIAIALFLGVGAASASPKAPPHARELDNLLACQSIRDDNQRLSCYDRQVAAIEGAATSGNLLVLDKDGVNTTRKSLFGFSLPGLDFLTGESAADHDQSALQTINAKIVAVRSAGYGKYLFTLDEGGEWQTIETLSNRLPEVGMIITIKRAALGSYLAKVANWPAVRIKRVG